VIFLTHTRLPDAPGGGRDGGGFHVHHGLAHALIGERARDAAESADRFPCALTAQVHREFHLPNAHGLADFLCDERVRLALAGDNLTVMVDTP
jgi:hypothetical protein